MVEGGDINNLEPGLSPGLALSLGHQCNGPVSWSRHIQFMLYWYETERRVHQVRTTEPKKKSCRIPFGAHTSMGQKHPHSAPFLWSTTSQSSSEHLYIALMSILSVMIYSNRTSHCAEKFIPSSLGASSHPPPYL